MDEHKQWSERWTLLSALAILRTIFFYLIISLHSFYFCLARADKSVDFSPFTPLFMFVHLPLIHFAPLPRLLIDFKNSKWLTYFCIYYAFVIVSLTWLAYFLSHDYLSYKFTRFFIYFLFLILKKGQCSKC